MSLVEYSQGYKIGWFCGQSSIFQTVLSCREVLLVTGRL